MSFWDSPENEIESQREKYEETLEQINNKVDTNGNRMVVFMLSILKGQWRGA